MSGVDLTGQQKAAAQVKSQTVAIMESVNQKIELMRRQLGTKLGSYSYQPENGIIRLGMRRLHTVHNANVITVKFGSEDVTVSFHDTANTFRDHILKAENTISYANLNADADKAAAKILVLMGRTEPFFGHALEMRSPASRGMCEQGI